jgi:hypothetical protein
MLLLEMGQKLSMKVLAELLAENSVYLSAQL